MSWRAPSLAALGGMAMVCAAVGCAGSGRDAGAGGSPATGGNSGSGGVTSSGGVATTGGSTDAADAPVGGSDGGVEVVHAQGLRPDASPEACGAWALTQGVCCAQYCSDDDRSESCDKCGGPGSAKCQVVNAKACGSGQWPEVHAVTDHEDWHYSRSTHFGLTYGGACAFGLYGLCTTQFTFTDGTLAAKCAAFCKAYPDLCKDPSSTSLRGNFAAPSGFYYTQFWPSLPGALDNYLSCGECFEVERTQNDGTEYTSGGGYTPPIVLQVVDSCPCSANSKWCCGSGRDHCGEVKGTFKYGCQLPPSPPDPAVDHDPLPGESIHLDLSDIAMARLQTGNANGNIVDGVIPTKYRRVPCPVVGNMYIWLRSGASAYYFALTVVNMAGLGSATKVEAQLPNGDWVLLVRDPNYTLARPQERYGTWVLPQGYGPFDLPFSIRVTDGSGRAVVADKVIKSWAPADSSQVETWYIDTGVQF